MRKRRVFFAGDVEGNTIANPGGCTADGIVLDTSSGSFQMGVFQGNSVSDVSGDGIRQTGGFPIDFTNAAGGNTTISNAGGNGITFENATGNLEFLDLQISNRNGAGLRVIGSNGFTISNTNPASSIISSGGPALDLDPLTANLVLSNVASTGSVTSGISLNQVSGSINFGALTTIRDTAQNGIEILDSPGTFVF